MPTPTPEQLAARTNPTPTTIYTPQSGLSTDTNHEWIYLKKADGSIVGTAVRNLVPNADSMTASASYAAGWDLLSKYGIDSGKLPTVNRADLDQQMIRSGKVGGNGVADYGHLTIEQLYNQQPGTLQAQTINAPQPAGTPGTTVVPQGTPLQGTQPVAAPNNGGGQAVGQQTPEQLAATVAATGQQPAPQATPTATATATGPTPPTITQNLTPGMSGPEVASLQQWLMQKGFSIPSLANGKAQPGFYGPETKAAVEAWQRSIGLQPNSPSDYGNFGPLSRTALASGKVSTTATSSSSSQQTESGGFSDMVNSLMKQWGITPPDPTKNPITSYTDVYGKIYSDLGLSDVKTHISELSKKYADLEGELTDKISGVNDNPWLSEGNRVREVSKLKDKYDLKLSNLNNEISIYEKSYDDGRADARYAAGQIVSETHSQQQLQEDFLMKAIDLTEKSLAAKTTTSSDIKSVQGGLYDVNSGTWVVKPKAKGSGSSDTFTQTQLNKGASNAGIEIGTFGNLGEDDQNFFINGFAAFAADQKAIAAGQKTAQQVANDIAASDQSDAVKKILYSKLGVQPGGGAAGAEHPILDFFGNIWHHITTGQ